MFDINFDYHNVNFRLYCFNEFTISKLIVSKN
jgi:hypothetical protein